MVFSLVTEAGLRASWWTLYQVYSGLYYVYYGQWPATPETKVNQQLEHIEEENRDLMRKIDELENLIRNQNKESNESPNQ